MTEFYQVPAGDWEKLNFVLRRLFDIVQNIDGRVSVIDLFNDLQLHGNRITGGPANQLRASETEFITKGFLKSVEAGTRIVELLKSGGKTPLPVSNAMISAGGGSSGGGGGGTGDHSALANLGYSASGHTGFVPSVRLITTVSPLTGGANLSADLTLSLNVGLIDHGALAGLGDDDHLQYLERSGVRAMTGAFKPAVQTLSFVNPIVGDASTGNQFRVTLTASGYVLGPFSSLTDGQRIIIEIIQDATGGRTFSLDSQFLTGFDTPPIVAGGDPSERDILGAYYISSLGKLIVTGFQRGF